MQSSSEPRATHFLRSHCFALSRPLFSSRKARAAASSAVSPIPAEPCLQA